MDVGVECKKLTLENFTSPANENSRYILTSPHSLRACARLGVKPVELLPKSLHEFKKCLDSTGLSHANIFQLYTEYEAERMEKLLRAKKERKKLIETEQKYPNDTLLSTDRKGSTTKYDQQTVLSDKDHHILTALQNHLIKKQQRTSGTDMMCMCNQKETQVSLTVQQCQEKIHLENLKKRYQQEKFQDLEIERYIRHQLLKKQMLNASLNATERRFHLLEKRSELQNTSLLQSATLTEHLECARTKYEEQKTKQQVVAAKWNEAHTKFEQSKLEKDLKNDLAHQSLMESIKHRHKQAEDRHQQVIAYRETQIKQSREDSLQRSQQCKLSVQCMERSLEKWRNEVDTHQKLSIERADQVTKETMRNKCEMIRQNREKRQLNHAANMSKVEKEMQLKRDGWEEENKHRQEKADTLHRQRQTHIQKSRAMAGYSAKLRAGLKEYYGNSFAEKCHQAEMYAMLEKKGRRQKASDHGQHSS